MLKPTMRLLSLAALAVAVACHQPEPAKSEPADAVTTAPTAPAPSAAEPAPSAAEPAPSAAEPAPSAAAPAADAPAAPAANPWTKPVDCAASAASPTMSSLPPEDRRRERLNCDLREELRVFVAARQACHAAADCTNVGGSCPFGCTIPVAQSAADAVTQKLATLVKRQQQAGTNCAYRCMAPQPPACVEGRCSAK